MSRSGGSAEHRWCKSICSSGTARSPSNGRSPELKQARPPPARAEQSQEAGSHSSALNILARSRSSSALLTAPPVQFLWTLDLCSQKKCILFYNTFLLVSTHEPQRRNQVIIHLMYSKNNSWRETAEIQITTVQSVHLKAKTITPLTVWRRVYNTPLQLLRCLSSMKYSELLTGLN